MPRLSVIQEIVFDLASNTAQPTHWTGYGFFGRMIAPGTKVTPQLLISALHPEDVDILMEHLERLHHISIGEIAACRLRFLHLCGDYVEAALAARLEECSSDAQVLLVRTTVMWTTPENAAPPFDLACIPAACSR